MSQDASAQTVLPCSQCGRAFAHSDVVQIAGNWVCSDCKPGYLSRVMATGGAAASPLGWHYGGFWIRFGARVIDGIVLLVPVVILAALLMPNLIRMRGAEPNGALAGISVYILFYFVAVICYEVLFLKYHGATPGKMACGLRVARSDGSDLGWGSCFGRFMMWNVVTSGIPYLNFVLMSISGIMTGTDAEKRALHDRVCDTRVVYKQSMA